MSIPHGGLLAPESMPDRCCQCPQREQDKDHKKCPVIVVNDGFTIDLGLEIKNAIVACTGLQPFMVINHLQRSKLDPNRELKIGAQCHEAQEAFKVYHQYIKSALQRLQKGLLIDLHGRGKSDGMTQLGYCLSKEVLTRGYTLEDLEQCSISNICDKKDDALKGPNSLGAFLQNEGLKAVPSPAYPIPASGISLKFSPQCLKILKNATFLMGF